MAKWFNGDMIPDGAAMMVRLFYHGNSICILEWILLLERFFYPGKLSWGTIIVAEYILSSRDSIPRYMSGGIVPGVFVSLDNT